MPDQKVTIKNPLLAEQARQFFHRQTQAVKTCLESLDGGGEDPELIHDLRVAARRFTSLLGQTEPFLDPKWCRQAGKIMRPVRKATNRLRDTTILIQRIEAMAVDLGPSPELIDLTARLKATQRKCWDKARHKLMDQNLRRQLEQLDDFLSTPASTAHLVRTLPQNEDLYALFCLKDVRAALLFSRTAELLALRQLLVAESELPAEVLQDPVLAASFLEIAPEVIHRIRLSAKDFRYVLEFLTPVLLPDPLAAWIGSFRTLQDQLGAAHDLDLAVARISDLEAHGPGGKSSREWSELCATLKRAWREERQTLLCQLQAQWTDWTAETFECKIYSLIFQKGDAPLA